MVGPHAGQALLYALQDVIAREDVRTGLAAGGGRRSHQTAALAREIVLGAPGADVASDALLAHAVVDRGVDIVDAGVEDGVENGFRLPRSEERRVGKEYNSQRSLAAEERKREA